METKPLSMEEVKRIARYEFSNVYRISRDNGVYLLWNSLGELFAEISIVSDTCVKLETLRGIEYLNRPFYQEF